MTGMLRSAIGVCFVTALLGGCGVYSASSGRVDESLKRVAVPFLENRTSEPDIGVSLTNQIIFALQEDNTLKVVDEDAADTLLEGAVTQYNIRQVSASNQQIVDEYQVQIAVELTLTKKATGEKLLDRKRFTGTGNYLLGDGSTSEATARQLAANEIVRDVIAQIVEDW